MKVGFYDVKNRCMTHVEQWSFSMNDARVTAAQMTDLFLSGRRHCLPSPVWCVWDASDIRSIFLLDELPRPADFYDQVALSMV
jgi:hypothetical protein